SGDRRSVGSYRGIADHRHPDGCAYLRAGPTALYGKFPFGKGHWKTREALPQAWGVVFGNPAFPRCAQSARVSEYAAAAGPGVPVGNEVPVFGGEINTD